VPADDGFGFEKNQWFSPIPPESREHDPDEPVSVFETWSLGISFQDIELMPQREVFQGKRTMRPQR
jgi:hypothetical protein